ncbi:hypothetical protein GQ651_16325 [Alphaproteobacteria bacterium GH1-50]|uniref:Translocation and assembly module TamB C-terminal domain-containing protein n=1 Tax=Kangsaoukella pontilimi TaxID=2691042 RepID=A0A7C9MYT3_9RHOB|nr:translocation/assembly module TamB domain-containing protein [Kangsaoukella pontilimi]MXQ09414.1 hypothetical protein [Kangsaoukella pontilimi]
MRALWLALSLSLAATPLAAQGLFDRIFGSDDESAEAEENPGGFLENLIEDNLSGEGRDVRITGFAGALGGTATLETMTISDPDGIWLTLEDVTLDWSRAALLRGRLEVNELSAASILLPRLPAPAEATDAPAPEASGFSLPELPVSVNIGRIAAERVEIGQPVFGAETVASVEGSLSLADGDGAADLDITRLNAPGSLTLDAGYSNESRVLALDLSLEEGPDGIVANLIDLPGRPSVAFAVTGEAPIDAYAADIRLATDGEERLTGRIETETPEDTPGAALRVLADIRGDIAPIFAPEYQAFFGQNVVLGTRITTFEDGRTALDDLSVSAASLDLSGQVLLAAGGLPQRIDIEGTVADPAGGPVLLPLTGPETRVDRIALDVDFDADEGDRWTGVFSIDGLDRAGFSAETLTLDGTGQIRGGDAAAVTANLDVEATRLDLGNPDAEEALGERVTGGADITWATGEPVRLTGLAIQGETYSLTGSATVSTSENGVDVTGEAEVRADDLSVFSGLAQRPLGGAVAVQSRFDAEPLAGFFDVTVTGTTTDLIVSQPEADRILAGEARLDLTAARDEAGIRATLDTLETPNASLTGQANLQSGASTVSASASLADAALILPQVTGPVRLTAAAEQDGEIWAWRANGGLEGTRIDAEGTARDLFGTPLVQATGIFAADDLSDFSELAGRGLGGSIDTRFAGEVLADLSRINGNLDGTATDIVTGIAEADRLLAGAVTFVIDGARAGEVYSVRDTRIEGDNLLLEADGTITASAGDARVSGRVTDARLLLQGAPEGPLTFAAETRRDGRDWNFDISADGPETRVSATGVALDPTGPARALAGRLQAEAGDLSIFSDLANRPLTGRLALTAEGEVSGDLQRFDLAANANGAGLSIGQAQADRLLAGDLSLVLDAARTGETSIDIGTLELTTRLLDVSANGALGMDGSAIEIDGRLADLAPLVPGFSGPATVAGTIGQASAGGDYSVDIVATGPGGTRATVQGGAAPDFATVDIDIDGTAPLGLANSFIQPRSIAGTAGFDLTLQGPPALESLSGDVTTEGARLVLPALGIILNDIRGNTRLSGGRAGLSLVAVGDAGGRLSVEGPITLSGNFGTDLTIRLADLVLTDPQLYETTVNGAVTIAGPLTGGARIAGDLALGETTIRIPSSSIGGTGAIPEVVHINEPPPVRGTRARAGLIQTASAERGGGPVYPLDIRINAPNQIFVRGRGLDSEFGGSLRITGTSADVVPIGAFNLIRGRLDILGQRLAIEEATITMQGSFVPVIRIVSTTQKDEFRISVVVSGPASNPEIEFVSEPELPEEEVLARLLFGRGLDTLSPFQAARLALAVRTLAGQGGEGLVGRVRDGAGLADFDVTTDADGNTEVRAGAYLSDTIYTDVTVDAEGETQLNLNLDLTPSVTVRGGASNTGDTSIGIFFERDY